MSVSAVTGGMGNIDYSFVDKYYDNDYSYSGSGFSSEKRGGVVDFAETVGGGLFRGAVNSLFGMVKGLFSLKGLMWMGLISAATMATGGAILPFLAASGIVLGGYKAGRGLFEGTSEYLNGNYSAADRAFESAGAGALTAGLSVVAARSLYRNGAVVSRYSQGANTITSREAGNQGLKSTVQHLYRDVTGQTTARVNGRTYGNMFQALKEGMVGQPGNRTPGFLQSLRPSQLPNTLKHAGIELVPGKTIPSLSGNIPPRVLDMAILSRPDFDKHPTFWHGSVA